QLDRLRANKLTEDQLKCTECVNKAATEERQKAALKASLRASQEGAAKATGATEGLLKCSVCEKQLSQSEFTNTQVRLGFETHPLETLLLPPLPYCSSLVCPVA
ncbi:unnamed protein product, partial [Chrysoparadoxa australica]